MKLSSLFTAALVLLPLGAEAASKDIRTETFTSQEKSRTYFLYVPPTIKPEAPAPLIVLLHGSGRNGLSLVEKWDKLARKEGIVLAGLDATNPAQWSSSTDGPEVVYDLVEELKAKYPIDPRRVYR